MAKQTDFYSLDQLLPLNKTITVGDRRIAETAGARYNVKHTNGSPILIKIVNGRIKFDVIRRQTDAEAKTTKQQKKKFQDNLGRDKLNMTISCSKKEYEIFEELEDFIIEKTIERQFPDADPSTIAKKFQKLKETRSAPEEADRVFSSRLFRSKEGYEEDYGITISIGYKNNADANDSRISTRVLIIDENNDSKMTEIKNPNISTVRKYFRYDSVCSIVFSIPSTHVGTKKMVRTYLQFIQLKPNQGIAKIEGTPFGGTIKDTKPEHESDSEEEQKPKSRPKASVKALLKKDRKLTSKKDSDVSESSETSEDEKKTKGRGGKKTVVAKPVLVNEESSSESETAKPAEKHEKQKATKKGGKKIEEEKKPKKKNIEIKTKPILVNKDESESESESKNDTKKEDVDSKLETGADKKKTKKNKSPKTQKNTKDKKPSEKFTLNQVFDEDEDEDED